jgi:peptide/nickel transport system substrate-binding protein
VSDIDSLNPVTLESTDGQMISNFISEGMLHLNDDTLKLEPCLADRWEISPDQLTYTFHLRPGIHFQDGTPVTVEDVKYTYERLQDPKVESSVRRSYFSSVKSCEILDPSTIRFVTTEKYFKMLEVLGTLIQVVPKHAFEHGNPDFNKNEFGRHPIGTGPYKFLRWDTGSEIMLERDDAYWNAAADPHYPKRIVFQVLQEPYVAAQLLKKGELDALSPVSAVVWKYDLEHSSVLKDHHKVLYPYPAYNYLGFNLRLPLFQDIRVRHAIDLLIPRAKILHDIYLDEYGVEVSGFDPVTTPFYDHNVPPTPTDPAEAMRLLNDAGWKMDAGDGLLHKDGAQLSFTLLYRSGSPGEQKMVELIQEALATAGIKANLSRLEFAQWVERVNDWNFDATMGGWGTDINSDPTQIWSSAEAKKKQSSNFLGYVSPEADKLMAAGRLEYDDDKRAMIYHQLQRMVHDDYPCCFLFSPKYILLVSDRYQNVHTFAPRPCFNVTKWWVPLDRQKYKD